MWCSKHEVQTRYQRSKNAKEYGWLHLQLENAATAESSAALKSVPSPPKQYMSCTRRNKLFMSPTAETVYIIGD